jgi:hypothetical protein
LDAPGGFTEVSAEALPADLRLLAGDAGSGGGAFLVAMAIFGIGLVDLSTSNSL